MIERFGLYMKTFSETLHFPISNLGKVSVPSDRLSNSCDTKTVLHDVTLLSDQLLLRNVPCKLALRNHLVGY